MATELVNFQHEMSRERFKQEAALIALRALMDATATLVADAFEGTKASDLNKVLAVFDDYRAKKYGRIAESVAEAATIALGPDSLPPRSPL